MTDLVCPMCNGLDDTQRRPDELRLDTPGMEWTSYADEITWTKFPAGATISSVQVRTNGVVSSVKFSVPKTMLPGDIMTVRYTVGACIGCGGTGTWLDYARRRMGGKVDAS